MSKKFYTALLTGTTLSCIAFSASAATVTINGGTQVVASDPNADPAINFLTNNQATINNGVNLTGTNGVAVSTSNNNQGTLRLNGSSTITGSVGAGNALNTISLATGDNKTVTFTSTVNAGTILGTGSFSNTVINFNNSVVANLDFGSNFPTGARFIFSDGANYTGTSTMNGLNGMTFQGNSTTYGTLGNFSGHHLVNLTFSGNAGKTLDIFSTLVSTNTIDITGTGTVRLNSGVDMIYGTTRFYADGSFIVASGVTQAGNNITNESGTDNVGSVTFLGGTVIDSFNSTANKLKSLTLSGDNTASYVNGTFLAANTTALNNNTVTVTGTATFTSGQTLSSVISGTSTFGHIDSTGIATVSSGTIVNITVNPNLQITNGQSFKIVSGVGGSGVGTISSLNITENDFVMSYAQNTSNAHELELVATRNMITPSTLGNNRNVATVLQALDYNGDNGLDAVQVQLNGSSSGAQYNSRLQSLQPAVDGGNIAAEVQASRAVFEVTTDRLEEIREGNSANTGVASGDITKGVGMWAQEIGQRGGQDDRDGINGYKFHTAATTIGIDSQNLSDRLVAGASFSVGNANVKSQNANAAKSDIGSYQASVFSDYSLAPKTYLTTMLGYAYNDVNETRYNIVSIAGNNANADYKEQQYIAYTELGHKFAVTDKMSLTPSVLGHYQHVAIDSYTETGSNANLTVDSKDIDILEFGTGLKADWELSDSSGNKFRPYLGAGYRYDVLGDRVQTISTFTGGGSSFSTQGADAAKGTASLVAGVVFKMSDRWDLTTNYEYQAKSDYNSQAAYARISYKF